MKIKGPIFIKGLSFYGPSSVIEVDIPASDLIAELEKRRPCEKCKDYLQVVCGNCVWDSLGQEDNFKEAK